MKNKTVYTFEEHATYENFRSILKQLIGVKMNYTQQLKQKDSEYVWHPFTQMGVYSKEEAIIIEKERVVTFTIRMAINI